MVTHAKDVNHVGLMLRARRYAAKEDMCEGMWFSADQREDEFKSKQHALQHTTTW